MSVGLPRQVPAFFGGYAFGLGLGIPLALAATLAGATASFLYARLISRRVFGRRAGTALGRIGAFLSRETFRAAIVLRLLPCRAQPRDQHRRRRLRGAAAAVPRRLGRGLPAADGNLRADGQRRHGGASLRVAIGIGLFVASSLIGLHLALAYRGLGPDDPDPAGEPPGSAR